jgi:hypothetical protein
MGSEIDMNNFQGIGVDDREEVLDGSQRIQQCEVRGASPLGVRRDSHPSQIVQRPGIVEGAFSPETVHRIRWTIHLPKFVRVVCLWANQRCLREQRRGAYQQRLRVSAHEGQIVQPLLLKPALAARSEDEHLRVVGSRRRSSTRAPSRSWSSGWRGHSRLFWSI